MTAENHDSKTHRVMVARVPSVDVQPRPSDLRPFLVRASELTDAVRVACEAAVLEGLAIQGKPSLPVDVHVVGLTRFYSEPPSAEWSAEVRWRSSGNVLCSAAGTVSRLP